MQGKPAAGAANAVPSSVLVPPVAGAPSATHPPPGTLPGQGGPPGAPPARGVATGAAGTTVASVATAPPLAGGPPMTAGAPTPVSAPNPATPHASHAGGTPSGMALPSFHTEAGAVGTLSAAQGPLLTVKSETDAIANVPPPIPSMMPELPELPMPGAGRPKPRKRSYSDMDSQRSVGSPAKRVRTNRSPGDREEYTKYFSQLTNFYYRNDRQLPSIRAIMKQFKVGFPKAKEIMTEWGAKEVGKTYDELKEVMTLRQEAKVTKKPGEEPMVEDTFSLLTRANLRAHEVTPPPDGRLHRARLGPKTMPMIAATGGALASDTLTFDQGLALGIGVPGMEVPPRMADANNLGVLLAHHPNGQLPGLPPAFGGGMTREENLKQLYAKNPNVVEFLRDMNDRAYGHLIEIENDNMEQNHATEFASVTATMEDYMSAVEMYGSGKVRCNECVHLFYACYFIAQKYHRTSNVTKAHDYTCRAMRWLRMIHSNVQPIPEEAQLAEHTGKLNANDAGVMWDKCVDCYILAGCIFKDNGQYEDAKNMFESGLLLSRLYEREAPGENTGACLEHLAYLESTYNYDKCIQWCKELLQVIPQMKLPPNMSEKDRELKEQNAKAFYGCILTQSPDPKLQEEGRAMCTSVVASVFNKDSDLMWRFCAYFGMHYARQRNWDMAKSHLDQIYKEKGGRQGQKRKQLLFDYLETYSEEIMRWVGETTNMTPEQKWEKLKNLKIMDLYVDQMKLYKDAEVRKTITIAYPRYRYAYIFYECHQYEQAAEIARILIDPKTPPHEQCPATIELFKHIQLLINGIVNIYIRHNMYKQLPEQFNPYVRKALETQVSRQYNGAFGAHMAPQMPDFLNGLNPHPNPHPHPHPHPHPQTAKVDVNVKVEHPANQSVDEKTDSKTEDADTQHESVNGVANNPHGPLTHVAPGGLSPEEKEPPSANAGGNAA